MRHPTIAIAALAAVGALAFAPVTTAAEGDTASLELTAAAEGLAVTGSLAFGGTLTAGTDAAGDATVPSAGLDVGDVRVSQEGRDLVFELDVLDAVAGDVAPTALYKIDVTGTLSLMAFRGPGVWDYQIADFSDGYTSSDAQGAFDGSTITWTVSASAFGSSFAPSYVSSQGVSPAGLASLQLSGFADVDAGRAAALFVTGGRIDVTVVDAEGAEVADGIAFATPSGEWSYDAPELAAGTYTVTATSAYADLVETATTTITVD